jgi:hypothetical protein
MELKSLSQRIECVRMESWSLRIFLVSLGDSSMRLGVPFIAPRQLEAVGDQQGRPFLPSVGWRTGQSGAPSDSHCRRSGADLLPFLAQTTVAPRRRLAHRTLSGAHRTVWCPLPTVGVGHVSPADFAADRCAVDRWLTGQSGADLLPFLAQTTVAPRRRLAHRTLSGAPLPTVGASHVSPADFAADRCAVDR